MASLYRRPKSKYLWIKFRDPQTNVIRRESTEFLADDRIHRQRARELVAERTYLESGRQRSSATQSWDQWVMKFLEQRHALALGTLSRKTTAWRHLSDYLTEIRIHSPQHLTRQHCLDYVAWRKQKGHGNSKTARRISHNTVLMELKCLSSIMQEAVRRNWVTFNPCHRLEIARELPREKRELSDSQIACIRQEIRRRKTAGHEHADFLEISFEIALSQGCRMAETWIPLSSIDLDNLEIAFSAKGRKRYVAPLNPTLVPLIKRLIVEGRTVTYTKPRMPSLIWFKFFDYLRSHHAGFDAVSFHSTRVTVVSRSERAGVPERVAMALVNHSSTTVHRIYRKIKKQELTAVWNALSTLNKDHS